MLWKYYDHRVISMSVKSARETNLLELNLSKDTSENEFKI